MTTRRALWPALFAMAVAGPAAVVASGITLASLARAAGWQGWTPWLLPATVDVAGFACGWYWLRPGAPDRARRFGRSAFVALTAGSIVGNGVGHLVSTGRVHPSSVLIVVVGAVPAAVLVVLGHLAALTIGVTDTPEEAAPVEAPVAAPVELAPNAAAPALEVPVDAPTPVAAPARRTPPPARKGGRRSDADLEAAALVHAANVRATDPGHVFSESEVMRALGVGSVRARRLRDLVNRERATTDEDEPVGERAL